MELKEIINKESPGVKKLEELGWKPEFYSNPNTVFFTNGTKPRLVIMRDYDEKEKKYLFATGYESHGKGFFKIILYDKTYSLQESLDFWLPTIAYNLLNSKSPNLH